MSKEEKEFLLTIITNHYLKNKELKISEKIMLKRIIKKLF